MKRKYDRLREEIADEIEDIEQVFKDLAKIRIAMECGEMDITQKSTAGTLLMNFYTGVENIVKRISKQYYQSMPKGASWHKELLLLACHPPEGKTPLFSLDIFHRLNPYRGFRHIFVSGYGFKLLPESLYSLINDAEGLWADIKSAIETFWVKLRAEGLLN